ncbi:hypothetical protein JCM8097_003897 [Rhodosporidiobolus ruineniae]
MATSSASPTTIWLRHLRLLVIFIRSFFSLRTFFSLLNHRLSIVFYRLSVAVDSTAFGCGVWIGLEVWEEGGELVRGRGCIVVESASLTSSRSTLFFSLLTIAFTRFRAALALPLASAASLTSSAMRAAGEVLGAVAGDSCCFHRCCDFVGPPTVGEGGLAGAGDWDGGVSSGEEKRGELLRFVVDGGAGCEGRGRRGGFAEGGEDGQGFADAGLEDEIKPMLSKTARNNMPSRHTIARAVPHLAKIGERNLIIFLRTVRGAIYILYDAWTSPHHISYMCIMIAFLYTDPETGRPSVSSCSRRCRVNIANVLKKTMVKFGIDNKAAAKALNEFGRLEGRDTWIRCTAHISNLMTQGVLKSFAFKAYDGGEDVPDEEDDVPDLIELPPQDLTAEEERNYLEDYIPLAADEEFTCAPSDTVTTEADAAVGEGGACYDLSDSNTVSAGPDNIPKAFLQMLYPHLRLRLTPLAAAALRLGHLPRL